MRDRELKEENRRIYEACAPELFRRLRSGFFYTVQSGERRFIKVPSRFEQEEVVQETFVRFLVQRNRGTFDSSRDPAPYLQRIGLYTALSYKGRLPRELPVEDVEFFAPSEDGPIFDASDELIRQERDAQIRSVTQRLNMKEQEVFSLTYDKGLSQSKVAQRLGLSRDQVYRALVRIRTEVLEHLSSLGWFDES